MTFGRRLVAAVVCVPLLAVGGCADDPKPKVAPPTETPTPTSPTATPTPEPWEKKTNAGAVAFAKHWVDVFNEAAQTGDTKALAEPWGAFVRLMYELREGHRGHLLRRGRTTRRNGWKVEQTSAADIGDDGTAVVALRIHQSSERITRPGEPVERTEAATVTYSAELGWEGGKWLMSHLDFMT